MNDSRMSAILSEIERELGIAIPTSPTPSSSDVPSSLKPLYEFSDGLSLPFANIYPSANFDSESFPGWVCFGFDNYFSYFLCHPSSHPSLTSWDHETGHEIKAVFTTAADWLENEYAQFISTDTPANTIHVSEISDSVSRAKVISEIKQVANKSSADLLLLVQTCNFRIANIVRSQAFSIVRNLHRLGVSCHVECDT